MRSVIISIVLLIVILLLIFLSLFYVTKQSNSMAEDLDNLKESVESSDWDLAKTQKDELMIIWSKDIKLLALIFDHEELDNIQITFARLDEFVNGEDKVASLAEISASKMLIQHLPKRDSITLDNVL